MFHLYFSFTVHTWTVTDALSSSQVTDKEMGEKEVHLLAQVSIKRKQRLPDTNLN